MSFSRAQDARGGLTCLAGRLLPSARSNWAVSVPAYLLALVSRPPENWRAWMAQMARDVEAGILEPDCARAAETYPQFVLRATESALEAFEAELRGLVIVPTRRSSGRSKG